MVFDEPVDVVTFDSFSAFGHPVSCIIHRQGIECFVVSHINYFTSEFFRKLLSVNRVMLPSW